MASTKTVKPIRRFGLYWVQLDPTVGCEMQKTRPCVVVSPDVLNNSLATVIVAPITSTLRQLPCRLPVRIKSKKGEIALDQMRCIDKSRLGTLLGQLDADVTKDLLLLLTELFAP